jgi:hypothetical protein
MSKIKINYTAEQLADIARQKQARKLEYRAKRKAIKNQMALNGWKQFDGDELPDQACVHISKFGPSNEHNIFQYGGCWIKGYTYYKGDIPETATQWIVTTDNGSAYKVGAQYMIWQIGFGGSQACWSSAAAKRSIKSLLTQGTTVPDPDYTT